MTFREATDLLSIPLERVAEVTGRSYDTILAYRNGRREVPPGVLAAIAKLARDRAAELVRLAEELEGAG